MLSISTVHRVTKTVAAWQRCCAEILPLADFAEIYTKIHTVLSQNFFQMSGCLHRKIPKKNILLKKFYKKMLF